MEYKIDSVKYPRAEMVMVMVCSNFRSELGKDIDLFGMTKE